MKRFKNFGVNNELISSNNSNIEPISNEYSCVAVTAMFDIGRNKVDGRDIHFYYKTFMETIKIELPIVIYLDSKLNWVDEVLEIRKNIGPTKIIVQDLEEIPFWKYRENVINILNSDFKSKIKYPNDITYVLPEYSLIQYSKFGWIDDAINYFNSKSYMWIDGGLSRFFTEIQKLRLNFNINYINNIIYNKKCLIEASRLDILNNATNDTYIGTNEAVLKGGIFIIPTSIFKIIYNSIMNKWENEMLSKNRYDNEQISLALIYKEKPELFSIIISNDLPYNSILNLLVDVI